MRRTLFSRGRRREGHGDKSGWLMAVAIACLAQLAGTDTVAQAQTSDRKVLVFRAPAAALTQKTVENFRKLVNDSLRTPDEKSQLLQALAEIERKNGAVTADDLAMLSKTFPDNAKNKMIIESVPPDELALEIQAQALRLLTNQPAKEEAIANWVATRILDDRSRLCTATLIGPRVLLTAAHCILAGNRFILELDKKPFELACERHPAYAERGFRAQFDYGLCRAAEDFPRTITTPPSKFKLGEKPEGQIVDLKFDRLSLDRRHAVPDSRDINSRWPLLSGYGCSDRQASKPDGRLRAGYARITFYGDLRLVTGSPQRDDSAIICQGDSGGAAYRLISRRGDSPNPDDRSPYGPRVIIGINSANILERNLSFLAKTSAPAFVQFFHTWRRRMGNPKVCGIDADIDHLCHP